MEWKIGGSVDMTRRRGRKRKQLLDDLKETKGHCKFEEEAIDGALWGMSFGRGYGLVR